MSKKAKRVARIHGNEDKYFEVGPGYDTDKGSAQYRGGMELKDGYSFVADQDRPDPVGYTQSKTAKKGGGFKYGEKKYIYDKVEKDDSNAWEEDYRDLRNIDATPQPAATQESPDIEYSPEIKNAQAFVNRYEQTDSPYNDLSSQDFLNSYKQGFDSRNSTEVEKVGANLNLDLPNNVETTDNNSFASGTFDPVNKADEAAQNFLTDKKNLVLNAFK